MSDDRNVFQKAADKTKEVAGDAKDKIVDTYYNMMCENTTEDKAARQIKDAVDDVKDKAKDMHEKGEKKWEELKDAAIQRQKYLDSAKDMHEKGEKKWEEFKDSADQRQKYLDSMGDARENLSYNAHEDARKLQGY